MVVGLKFVSIVDFTFCCWYNCVCNFLVAFFLNIFILILCRSPHPPPPFLTPHVLAVLFIKCKSKKYIALQDRSKVFELAVITSEKDIKMTQNTVPP